ncbi:hypothetical protein SKAU_G00003220 [Synaphobranchus kaupii]|uniref:Uncharacterized protein n=1 Tax=Synaphobranchus kaupii TaxID=118154 RepID=A0A9Q1JCS4_SYNKA|nr:hypothetical protein SKAU_G00003220 [Synaphobranchus kaupii]
MRSPQLSGARPSDFHTAPGVPHLLRVLRNRKSTALKNLRDVCCKLSSEVLGRSQGKEEVLFWHRQASAEHGTEASMPRRSPPPSFSPRSQLAGYQGFISPHKRAAAFLIVIPSPSPSRGHFRMQFAEDEIVRLH